MSLKMTARDIVRYSKQGRFTGAEVVIDLSEGDTCSGVTVRIGPTARPEAQGDSFTPAEVLTALKAYYEVEGNVVTLDMREPNTHRGVTLETISHKGPVVKPRHLKRLSQLKGLTIESVKTVKQGTKAYIKTTDGGGICIENAEVLQTLHCDENIALGLLTKEDLASIAKAKKMGLI